MAIQITPRSAPPPAPPRSHARTQRPSGFRNWLYRVDVKAAPYAYVSPFFLLYALFGLFPVLYTGWVSLHDWNFTEDDHPFVGLKNYRALLHDEYFYGALWNTFSILALATVPQLILALLLASLLNSRLRGNTFWRMGMLLPNVTSVVAVAVIFSQLFGRDYGFFNWILRDLLHVGTIDWDNGRASSHIAIATMITWRWTGYNALIFLAAMQAIPGELYESARLDGATTMQQLRKITIPMIRPTLIFVLITSVIYGMQVFAEPQIFGGAGPDGTTGGSGRQFQTLTLYLYENGWSKFELGYASAIAYAIFALIIVVTAVNYLIIRRIREQLMKKNYTPGGKTAKLVYLTLIAILFFSSFPLYFSFIVASEDNSVLARTPPPLLPGPNLVANIERVFDTVEFGKAMINSLIITSTITISVVFFSTLAGFAFAKLRFRGSTVLLLATVGTMMVPAQLGIIPLYLLMIKLEWTGQLQAVIVPALVNAFGVFFMTQYLREALPSELLEAGRMDGCSSIKLFFHVVVPAARPAAAVLGMLTFLSAWNDYMWPLIVLGNTDNPTVQTALSALRSGYVTDYSLSLTGTLLATLPLLALFILLGRQLIGGIMQGAVKG